MVLNILTRSKIFYHLKQQLCSFQRQLGFGSIKTENILNSKSSIKLRPKQENKIYITDPIISNTIAKHIAENWKNKYIFEVNSGPGKITEALLKTDINYLRIFEKNEEYIPKLKDLSSRFPKLELVEKDLFSLTGLESKLWKEDTDDLECFCHNIPLCMWKNDPPLRIFTITFTNKSIRFLRYLLVALTKKTSIFTYGRCEIFTVLPQREYYYMISEPKENFAVYRWSTVLYNSFFDIQFLEKFPVDGFSPSFTKHMKKKFGGDHFYFVKMTPKEDLYSDIVRDNKLSEFYFFIRHHLVKRTALVIPTLENWIPFCGPRLIKEGMNVFTKFGELSPVQLLVLFNQFSSWPEYEHSTFIAALNRYYGKRTDEEEAETKT